MREITQEDLDYNPILIELGYELGDSLSTKTADEGPITGPKNPPPVPPH